jgi:hypothetical protein
MTVSVTCGQGASYPYASSVSDGLASHAEASGIIMVTSTNPVVQLGVQPLPEPVTAYAIQPVGDANGAKGVFAQCLIGAPQGGGIFDSVGSWGYNVDNGVTSEPQMSIAMEQNFPFGGVNSTEFHLIQTTSVTSGGVSNRMFTSNMNRTTGCCNLTLGFRQIDGDPYQGKFVLQDYGSHGTVYIELGSGTGFYTLDVNSAQSGGFRGPSGTETFGSGTTNGLTVRSSLSAHDLHVVQTDSADNIVFGLGSGVNVAGGYQFNGPTLTITATSGTNGAAPSQVLGYMPITWNGVAGRIPVYKP